MAQAPSGPDIGQAIPGGAWTIATAIVTGLTVGIPKGVSVLVAYLRTRDDAHSAERGKFMEMLETERRERQVIFDGWLAVQKELISAHAEIKSAVSGVMDTATAIMDRLERVEDDLRGRPSKENVTLCAASH